MKKLEKLVKTICFVVPGIEEAGKSSENRLLRLSWALAHIILQHTTHYSILYRTISYYTRL